MTRVGDAERQVAPARAALFSGVAAIAVAALTLSACSGTSGQGDAGAVAPPVSGGTSSGSGGSTPTAPPSVSNEPAVITTSVVNRAVSPAKPVTVGIAHGTLTSVVLTNPAGKRVHGALSPDGATWRTTESLGYSKTYQLVADGRNAAGAPVHKTATVRTLTPGNLTMPYLDTAFGGSLEDGGTYGVGMVVRIHFDEDVDRAKAERAIKISTSKDIGESGFHWTDDANAYWRPRHYFTPGTKVTVAANVYGKNVGHGLYGQADQQVSFTIGAKHVSIADNDTHQVKVFFDDKLQRTLPTSMGMGGSTKGKDGQTIFFNTPNGNYTVMDHENPANMSSDSYGLPADSPFGYKAEEVPWATRISTDGIYLHELDSTVPVQGKENVSHGCLNLNQDNAKWYYQTARVGDIVKVIHSEGPSLQLWQGGYWGSWSEWTSGEAL